MKNIYDEIEDTRKPRVHIRYDVETENGAITKELPFVVGVMGDFSGDTSKPSKPLSDRKFIQIDKDNFDEVMSKMSPGVEILVDNKITNDNTKIPIQLEFNSIEDFNPENIVKQIPALNKVMEVRNKLRDLITLVDRSENLESLLEQILQEEIPCLTEKNKNSHE